MRQGRNDESLQLLEIQIPPSLAQSDIAIWQKLTQGSALAYTAKFPEAAAALSSAQELAKIAQPQLEGETLLRLGTLASLQRDLSRAQTLFRTCLEFARLHKDEYLEASALGSLGLVAARLEHYDESIDWNQRALDLDKANSWLGLAARAEGNMGWSYYLIGDLVNALDLYKKADQHDIEAGAPERRITWLNGAGDVYYDMRDFSAAESASAQALRLADSLHDTDDAIYCLQNLALISIAQHKFDAARTYVEDALSREAAAPDHVRELDTQLISAQLAVKTAEYEKAATIFDRIKNDPASPVHVHWEALSGLAQAHASLGKSARAEREFQEAIATISGAQESIEKEDFRLSFLSIAIQFYDQYINFLLGLHRPLDALNIADRSRAQTLEHGLSSTATNRPSQSASFDPQTIARQQNATLLFYWLGPERSYLWVLTPSKVSLLPLPPGPEIDALALSYRDSLFGPRDPLDSSEGPGQELYDILVRPAQKLISPNSSVVILPDSKLNGLNFETLVVDQPQKHYWIEDVTVTVGNSLALLARSSRVPPPKSPELLFFGDALPATREFPPLADAKLEIDALKTHFPETRRRMFTGGQAIPSNYLSSDPGRYSFLHFATHGTASTSRPLESAIILSPEGDRYKLYARDIMRQPLSAYLVSISACNGAGTRQLAGEGLVGLSWAFLRAGAHNVVAGLWEVSTASAPQIMDGLYKGLAEGKSPAASLRNAKLALLHSRGPHQRPFYWAPFQLYSGS
jgi:CHAT domain-containing protein/Flp pilus assembly protein TadD